jgi:preprotein translocase subunit SecD
MKTKNRFRFGICTLLIIVAFYVLMVGVNLGNYRINSLPSLIDLGLDLKGGVSIEMQITDGPTDDDTLARTKQLLELRVNSMGVSEATVTVNKTTNRFTIEIPGVYDTNEALKTLGQTGELTFVGPDESVILTGDDVKESGVGVDSSNQPVVQLKLKDEGTTKFAEATQKYYGQVIKINMDGQEVSAPQVNAVITDGEAIITVGGDLEEAKRISSIIESGALPVTLKSASEDLTGATLGAEAVPTSMKATIIGIAGVMLFMLLYYKAPGLVADFALAVYIILTFGVYVIIGQVLSLPGIAGFLLSVGMAVDANVLIFERMKEELRLGKSLSSAVDSGFHRAFSSIFDSNITTVIAGLTLYTLGRGTVRGFALTLTIGVVCSMFTAITVTRFLLKALVGSGWIKNIKWFIPIVK